MALSAQTGGAISPFDIITIYDLSERGLNIFSYQLMGQNKIEEALKIFKLNTIPKSIHLPLLLTPLLLSTIGCNNQGTSDPNKENPLRLPPAGSVEMKSSDLIINISNDSIFIADVS